MCDAIRLMKVESFPKMSNRIYVRGMICDFRNSLEASPHHIFIIYMCIYSGGEEDTRAPQPRMHSR